MCIYLSSNCMLYNIFRVFNCPVINVYSYLCYHVTYYSKTDNTSSSYCYWDCYWGNNNNTFVPWLLCIVFLWLAVSTFVLTLCCLYVSVLTLCCLYVSVRQSLCICICMFILNTLNQKYYIACCCYLYFYFNLSRIV